VGLKDKENALELENRFSQIIYKRENKIKAQLDKTNAQTDTLKLQLINREKKFKKDIEVLDGTVAEMKEEVFSLFFFFFVHFFLY
jgi:flagellar capping protein FliD